MTLKQAIDGISYHLWSSEKPVGKFIVALSEMCNFKDIIEVGTFKGLTSCYIIDYVTRIDGTFTSIDIEDHRDESVKEYFKESKQKFILNNSLIELENFPDRSADLIFLDSFHGLEQVRSEFKKSERIIRQNGLICIHDYFSSDGVPVWVDYLKEEQFKGNLKYFEIVNLDTPEHRGFTIVKYIGE